MGDPIEQRRELIPGLSMALPPEFIFGGSALKPFLMLTLKF